MKARFTATAWIDSDPHTVVLVVERTDEDEVRIGWQWPDYLQRPGDDLHLSDVDAAGVAGALAAILGSDAP